MIWGTTYLATTQLLPAGHPLFAALVRSLPAGVIALLLSRTLPRGSWWWKSLVLTKRWGRPAGISALALAGWQLTAAGLVLLVPALVIDGIPEAIDGKALAGYAWLAIPGALASYSIWFSGIRRLPVTSTALLGLLSPLVAAVLGVLVAGETLVPVQLAGFALALFAMLAGQLSPPRGRARPEARGTTG